MSELGTMNARVDGAIFTAPAAEAELPAALAPAPVALPLPGDSIGRAGATTGFGLTPFTAAPLESQSPPAGSFRRPNRPPP